MSNAQKKINPLTADASPNFYMPNNMKKIIYGTTNPAKVAQVKDVLSPLGFDVQSLADFTQKITVEENGKTAEENARKKATKYAEELGELVLSMDVALYFNNLPAAQQPGLHVRRLNGNEHASDEEMVAHYTHVAQSAGGRLKGYWQYAFALARPNGRCVSFTHNTPRIFTSKPSKTIIKGYPLNSLQIDPVSGAYISEMSKNELALYWRNSIGAPLATFVQENC